MSFRLPISPDLMRRSLVPSRTSGVICAVAAMITVAIGLLDSGIQQGLVPFGSQIKLDSLPPIAGFKSSLLQGGLMLFMWLAILVVAFLVIEYLLGVFSDSESGQSEKRWVINRLVWRLIVSFAFVDVILIAVPVIHWMSSAEKNIVAGQASPAVVIVLTVLFWAVMYHITTVFLRLFVLRKAYISLS